MARPASAYAHELVRLVAAHPLRERLDELLMPALCRTGRPSDALTAYEAGRPPPPRRDPGDRSSVSDRSTDTTVSATVLAAWSTCPSRLTAAPSYSPSLLREREEARPGSRRVLSG
ncbi:BTAD domain-containing putative transcriptional regulator [Streptomyces sp. NPDC052773]|uniref:BTAD domain-containing putative transcriptional regulator n=1 Tax=Streptomyces sp. NPDC052773 TaxID=3365693 RepID=UPI0037D4339F